MANDPTNETSESKSESAAPALEQGTYEIIRQRLANHGVDLRSRLERLNHSRQEVFGSIETTLVATDRITTKNNCVARDLVPIGGNRFIFGYNVHIGLRTETKLDDVFAVYERKENQFHEASLDGLRSGDFEADFKSLYKYYKNTVFVKFSVIGPHLFMAFRVGKDVSDVKAFKWLCHDGALEYLGNRFDHEYRFPPQHQFGWIRTHRELHRSGLHPHISIEDRVFVECVGGDVTIKVEDNTASGEGIYSEPVEDPDQTLDDAEVYYASVGNLILLRLRPYQEKSFRYFVFNEKLQQVRRIDAIADACVLLPEDHGIIFSNGYYLQNGEVKAFDSALTDMLYYTRLQSPNGEDFLFVFYNRQDGDYILMSYNLIAQQVEAPIHCHGFAFFENGEMAIFKADDEPQKHHVIQVWQTPFVSASWQPEVRTDSYLYKIGNPGLVGCMAECHDVLYLLGKDDSYANLYLDVVKKTGDIVDAYFWLDRQETFELRQPLSEIRSAAESALAEFDKVVRMRKSSKAEFERVQQRVRDIVGAIRYGDFGEIGQFVSSLADLRVVRGEVISLRDLRYVDPDAVGALETKVAGHSERLSQATVEFLLKEEALDPYRDRVGELQDLVPDLKKGTEAKALEERVNESGQELEMLIEVVSNLKIDDATETTRIIENISAIYATLNQVRASLKNKRKELQSAEAVAEFASQIRLLDQGVVNFLDLCDAPEKCDEYLTKLMVQIEELEARFADFDEFVIQLSEKRSELAAAFENRKLELVEARNKKANGLLTAAERILQGIRHRIGNLKSVNEINGYFAGDLMIEKVRDIVASLIELGDANKADDLQSRLKTIREEGVRQLKDKQDLFEAGENLIKFGKHRFSTNPQELDLTIVHRGEQMFLHLTGTNFFEAIEDEAFLATKGVWNQGVVSENAGVYRAEYLAYQILVRLEGEGRLQEAVEWDDEERAAFVREFMAPRYAESYVKGVHDQDASKLVGALVEMQVGLGLLRYPSDARACAAHFWYQFPEGDQRELITAKLRGYGTMKQLFPSHETQERYIGELQGLMEAFVQRTDLFPAEVLRAAAEYLYYQIKLDAEFVVSAEAHSLFEGFEHHLHTHHFTDAFKAARQAVETDLPNLFELLREWMRGYATSQTNADSLEYIDEATFLLLRGSHLKRGLIDVPVRREIKGMVGNHGVVSEGIYTLHYIRFIQRLAQFETEVVPEFQRYQSLKKQVVERAREEMRLDEFKPRVLTSFVRNRLIDSVYLPVIGDNLAKQIGVAGEGKRTDLMGLLLLVSPPGYGKTTLMEYLANRLGIVFMKVNGPAIGHKVSSLDPAEAPNSAAREELEKLNLAFEMGDNVMIYLDDIQHLNPEFLQKFISLCDAQRKIEGIYKGRSKTYDLRGKKVCVIMAGNPYTESGEKFKIPDMLSNRADTYNLGDIIGGNAEAFELSYLENALTSNPILNPMASRSQKDVYAVIKLAETGSQEGIEIEGAYSPEELNEMVAVMRKLIRVRDVVLRVNQEYIQSAAQADAYRTEPPFKLQGSYRNMNRMAEKILPVMNDDELEALIFDHYRNKAQTLTQGAEANLLKFREIIDSLTEEESQRWDEIKKTFKKNLLFHGSDERDPVSQVVQQLSAFHDGLDGIKETIAAAMKSQPTEQRPVTLIVAPASGVPEEKKSARTTKNPTKGDKAKAQPATSVVVSDGVKEVQITSDTLKKIWNVIEQQYPATPQKKDAGKSDVDPPPTTIRMPESKDAPNTEGGGD